MTVSLSRRALPLALPLLILMCLRHHPERVMTKFAECKTLTNAVNVKLEQVWPDGRWTATVMQTQSDDNHLVDCMKDDAVSATLLRRQADNGNGFASANLGDVLHGPSVRVRNWSHQGPR